MYSVANTSHQVLRVAETRGSGLSLWDFYFQALFSHKVQKYLLYFFNKNCNSRLWQGSRGWVFKNTYSISGVRGTQDKSPRVKLSPVVSVKPVRGCKKQSHCIEIVLSCSQ